MNSLEHVGQLVNFLGKFESKIFVDGYDLLTEKKEAYDESLRPEMHVLVYVISYNHLEENSRNYRPLVIWNVDVVLVDEYFDVDAEQRLRQG